MSRIITIIFFILYTFSLIKCKKPEGDDLSGTNELKGTLFINDTLTSYAGESLLINNPVQVKYLGDSGSQNFMYQQNSSANGGFTFTNVDSTKDYLIQSEKTIGNITFSAKKRITADSNFSDAHKLVLYPDFSKNNFLVITCRDKLTNGLLSQTKVCFFTSKLLADSSQCAGNIWSEQADIFGKVIKDRIPPGIYYINARDSVAPNVDLKIKDTVEIFATGLRQKTVYLE